MRSWIEGPPFLSQSTLNVAADALDTTKADAIKPVRIDFFSRIISLSLFPNTPSSILDYNFQDRKWNLSSLREFEAILGPLVRLWLSATDRRIVIYVGFTSSSGNSDAEYPLLEALRT